MTVDDGIYKITRKEITDRDLLLRSGEHVTLYFEHGEDEDEARAIRKVEEYWDSRREAEEWMHETTHIKVKNEEFYARGVKI